MKPPTDLEQALDALERAAAVYDRHGIFNPGPLQADLIAARDAVVNLVAQRDAALAAQEIALARLREDAERLDWLQVMLADYAVDLFGPDLSQNDSDYGVKVHGTYGIHIAPTLRQAIDTARADAARGGET